MKYRVRVSLFTAASIMYLYLFHIIISMKNYMFD